ncbi:MAG: bifunctional 3-phenylpropionate/cinnamic acid dioxygenase ferredoxin subunit [Candidatus Binatus sp.]|uniref:bifunctional 3-phenylpropionate/cinnamic acid dioxygenase ferredoxin subunit n=1 Tax=Candidatus Binatus sp. TaxID=2811406 RepID=UPI002725BC62|nr:bifunctional 3-phenylpropionate/cinnamic acid dioxygenase ferredoxin subunit [Candidatus Binatus sp.]MDO8434168.1 bifunctional 3-phenylpropionate/cinnamic acid dioxygenase ferredoxin subunit [Candidatus Binatus sp.]
MALIRVCGLDELADGAAIKLERTPPIAMFRVGDKYYAVDDTCTHAQSSLSEGYIEGDAVECAFHGARFCLRTGKVLMLPASKPLRTYPVKVEGNEIFVEIE